MKKVLLFIILFPLFANAQDSISSSRLGLVFAITPGPVAPSDFALHGGISFSAGKHEAFVSCLFTHRLEDTLGPFPGVSIGYRFYPNGKRKRFNLLLSYDASYFSKIIEQHLNGPPSLPDTEVRDYFSLENYFGFGFNLNIFQNLFISLNSGVGFGKEYEDRYYRYADGTRLNSPGNYQSSFALTTRFAVTYNFLSFKRK